MKKKLDGGLKKILIFFLFYIFSSKICYGSQILDYETEEFIDQIIEDIIEVNKLNKKIKFKINNSNEINAFVDINNVIHINSGLILYCSDYVALLSVLAHEIGHIDLNHIVHRKKTIENSRKYNTLSVLSVIAGSTLTQNPQLLQGSILTSAALSNQYIIFSKDQEMETDLYALKTLNLLNTNSKSIQTLLEKNFRF
ncbi:M48 family metalloprotease [Pelagibacteraceae bacterium]|nr:M48 family metalloprotease [Pelagibacteraceae bacterium]